MYMYFLLCILFVFGAFLLISSYGKPVWFFVVYVIIYCVGAGKTTLMSISYRLDPYFFRRKMERTRSMKEELDGGVFISRQSRHFSFIDNMIKVLFPIFTLNWRVNNYFSRQGEGINMRNEIIFIMIYFYNLWYSINFLENVNCLLLIETFPS